MDADDGQYHFQLKKRVWAHCLIWVEIYQTLYWNNFLLYLYVPMEMPAMILQGYSFHT